MRTVTQFFNLHWFFANNGRAKQKLSPNLAGTAK